MAIDAGRRLSVVELAAELSIGFIRAADELIAQATNAAAKGEGFTFRGTVQRTGGGPIELEVPMSAATCRMIARPPTGVDIRDAVRACLAQGSLDTLMSGSAVAVSKDREEKVPGRYPEPATPAGLRLLANGPERMSLGEMRQAMMTFLNLVALSMVPADSVIRLGCPCCGWTETRLTAAELAEVRNPRANFEDLGKAVARRVSQLAKPRMEKRAGGSGGRPGY